MRLNCDGLGEKAGERCGLLLSSSPTYLEQLYNLPQGANNYNNTTQGSIFFPNFGRRYLYDVPSQQALRVQERDV